jgi:hypothetical protein
MGYVLFIVVVIALFMIAGLWLGRIKHQRAQFIRTYPFPKGLFDKFEQRRPGLERKHTALTGRALRKFFLAYLNGGKKSIAMPSQAADDLWHEFILYTREYQRFCNQAFGGFFHHTPAAVMGQGKDSNAGLRRAWWQCCQEENIDPKAPTRLPLLFALDTKLKLADGFRYDTQCNGQVKRTDSNGTTFCASGFSDSSVDGGLDGFGADGSGDAGSSADSGGCSGGCGGGGD